MRAQRAVTARGETACELSRPVLLLSFHVIRQSAAHGVASCHASPAQPLSPPPASRGAFLTGPLPQVSPFFLFPQVYNEQIHDLLEPKGPLAIREDPDKGVVVQGLSFHQVWDWARVAQAAPLVLWGSFTRQVEDALDPMVVAVARG